MFICQELNITLKAKGDKGWRLESVFPWKKRLITDPHPQTGMWAKGVEAFTFHKKTNISNARQLFHFRRWKSLNVFFFWWSVKTQRCSSLLLDVETVKNLMTFPKHSSLLRCKSWKTYWDQGERRCHVIFCWNGHMFARRRHEINCFFQGRNYA